MCLLFRIFLLLSCLPAWANDRFDILDEQPQDPVTFTQGLAMHGETLFISSGLYGKSFLKSLSDEGVKKAFIDKRYFAEGLTIFNDRLYVLTWKAGVLFELAPDTLTLLDQKSYQGRGWGLTHDGQFLLMSDGSHYIQYRDPNDFSRIKYLRVTRNGKRLSKLNELEYAHGFIWANVWFSDVIFKIDPSTGEVVDEWDMTALVAALDLNDKDAVLNGIAYDTARDAFWVTGKLWPKRYLVRFSGADKATENTQSQ